jgi:rubrerythrin
MALNFNAREVFDMGVRIEVNGKAFYEAAAKRAENAPARKLFLELAEWESQHAALFEKMRDGLPKSAGNSDIFDPSGEAALYIQAAADSHVFLKNDDIVGLVTGCKGPLETLDLALMFEKDSVVFYAAMKKAVPPHLGGDKIERIMSEEIKHIGILIDKEKQLVTK